MSPDELRRRRRRVGLTQATLAPLLGVTATSVARWERGEVPIPMENAIRALLLQLEQKQRVQDDTP